MTSLLSTIRKGSGFKAADVISFDEWVSFFNFNGMSYGFSELGGTLGGNREEIGSNFVGVAQGAYRSNGVVFACMLVRQMLFSEARMQYRQMRKGRPGDLFGTTDLQLLEQPWPNGTTGDLLSRMLQDADLAGNFFGTVRGIGENRRIRRMRPDWVTIVMGSKADPAITSSDLDADLLGYIYHPAGGGKDPEILLPEQVCHFAPIPDPLASYRGMSWLTPIIREIMSDGAMTTHKLKYFENGCTPNMVVSLDPSIKREAFEQWIELFEENHTGVLNAYKTLYLGAGADAKIVGSDLKQIDFKVVQGATETRIAAAAGVPPVIVGLSEGLAAATYANYGQARRRLTDGTMRPLWRNAAGSLQTLVPRLPDAELWYDDRDIAFLQEDQKDNAEIKQVQAATIRSLIDAGYKPDSVVAAVSSGDFSLLVHTGLYSVQLQPPGTTFVPTGSPNDVTSGSRNGSGSAPAGALTGQ
jgi:phage portal protein BeeE